MNSPSAFYIDALLKNDEKILKQLYVESIPTVNAYILKNNGSETDASDIFQDALLAIFQKATSGKLQIQGAFQPYLFAVCRNLWLMQLRKKTQKRVTITEQSQHIAVTDSFGDAEQTAHEYARFRLLEEQLQQIGESCRNLLKLAWSGISLEEVARMLNNSYAYIRKKKSECIGKLMQNIRATPEYAMLKG